MKQRNTILVIGIISILIFISVQVIILEGVYTQKSEMFNLRYRVYSQDAIDIMDKRWSTDGFDTARLLIGRYSEKAVKEISGLKDDSVLFLKKKDILVFVNKALNQEQNLSQWLSGYFERQGIEKDFTFKININNLELIDNEKRIPVFQSEEFSKRIAQRKEPPSDRQRPQKKRLTKEILVKSDRSESDFYRLDFDYFIDFSDKQKVILKETGFSLTLSVISILIVVTLFLITYRNLREEQRLSNLKTDFINNMTHELKTPLSTITVAGKTLEMPQIRSDDNKILETAKLIGKQSIHLNQLINLILEISMWERTQFQLERKKADIEEVMNDIVESFKTGCGNCATFTRKYNLSGVKVDLDIVYFTTLINNLLSNAVKYSDKDPAIEIDGFTENNTVCIKVSDNGIGISRKDQKHIFDKFYRASTGNIHKYKGLGLGLYYVKKIAVAHGGDVSVTSKPGKGSIFTVTIPF